MFRDADNDEGKSKENSEIPEDGADGDEEGGYQGRPNNTPQARAP